MNKLKEALHLLFPIVFLVACKKASLEEPFINEKPIAIAGPDQVIAIDSVFLSGGNSYKNNGTITGYLWTKIYGPDTFNIKDPTAVKTFVNKLVQGVYGFELKVTDNSGLFAKDTVEVRVIFPPPNLCNNSNRPEVNAQLIPVGVLSEARFGMAVASAGNKILFAGGYNYVGPTSRIDIYDIITQAWSTAELSVAGSNIKAVTCGNKIFVVAGQYDSGDPCKYIDVYDVITNTWTVDSLSEPRYEITIGSIGNKVFFAGGEYRYLDGLYSSTVEIYDLSSNTWTTHNFNVGRTYMTTVAVNNKLYFAGGLESFNDDALDRIDIYDDASNSWSVSHLHEPKVGFAAIAVADKIYWAGGVNACSVEIKDINTGTSSNAYLYSAGDNVGDKAVTKDGKIIFRPRYYYDNKFDIYDIATASWSIGILPVGIYRSSIISVNNTIYLAGGDLNGPLSNQVWKMEF